MDNKEFYKYLRERFKEVYSYNGLKKKFNIESIALGACLCSEKNNEDALIVFNVIESENGKKYYCRGTK